eukprot:gnl/TRDRNA2_/TRDRNA2_76410_c1_seq1.p2 gnl/TRDRNA2_/TRDRNA2_76410_c1~~gnl/TRDRNA2_/TRDRNA2_76410_c1_seq1.p2  ORF type:complete len:149 (-),score=10.12 gnl/TRDRNA2_/TRDRNA2_76410_c1_seq1:40-486(-)
MVEKTQPEVQEHKNFVIPTCMPSVTQLVQRSRKNRSSAKNITEAANTTKKSRPMKSSVNGCVVRQELPAELPDFSDTVDPIASSSHGTLQGRLLLLLSDLLPTVEAGSSLVQATVTAGLGEKSFAGIQPLSVRPPLSPRDPNPSTVKS